MNQGALALQARIRELALGQNEAARKVEADTGNFSRILSGKALPGRKIAANIRREFGVEPDLFDQVAEGAA